MMWLFWMIVGIILAELVMSQSLMNDEDKDQEDDDDEGYNL